MSFLSDAASWLADTLEEHASESVTYTRGANSVTVDAVIGRRARRELQQPAARAVQIGEPMEFQFDPADLVLNGATITPAHGDKVTWGSRVYQAKAREGESLWGPSDAFGNLYTLRTLRFS